jgi:hypothetical protein
MDYCVVARGYRFEPPRFSLVVRPALNDISMDRIEMITFAGADLERLVVYLRKRGDDAVDECLVHRSLPERNGVEICRRLAASQ